MMEIVWPQFSEDDRMRKRMRDDSAATTVVRTE